MSAGAQQTTESTGGQRLRDPWLMATAVGLGLLEGIDLTAVGYTLSRMSTDLGLNSSQAGLIASAALFGLMLGAVIGGRSADNYGRRPVIAASVVLIAVGSIWTAIAWDYNSLLLARLVAGLGLGGLFPMLVAMAREAAQPSFRSTAIGIMMASGPLGGIAAGLMALHPDWRLVYYIGGVGPLLFLPLAWRRVSTSIPVREAALEGATKVTFFDAFAGDKRLTGTLLIWTIAFCSTLVVYVLLNWLPSLLTAQGIGAVESHIAFIVYSVGGIFGNIAGGIGVDRKAPRLVYAIGYGGAALCVLGIVSGVDGIGLYLLAFGVNFFMLSAQMVTLALTNTFYPEASRSTGVGTMISVGRFGSVVGPLVVGGLLFMGLEAQQVLIGLVPLYLVALTLGIALTAVLRTRSSPV